MFRCCGVLVPALTTSKYFIKSRDINRRYAKKRKVDESRAIVSNKGNQTIPASARRSSSLEFPSDDTPWLNDLSISWDSLEMRKRYLGWLGQKLGFHRPEDWYKITHLDFIKNSGGKLLAHFQGSSFNLLRSTYTDFEYFPWLFVRVTKAFWDSRETRLSYINWLKSRTGVGDQSELGGKHFEENRGSVLLRLYGGSPQKVIESLSVDPDDGAEVWKRNPKPKNYWASIVNQRFALDKVSEKIGALDGNMEPWYSIPVSALEEYKLGRILKIYKHSKYHMLSKVYPEHKWLPWKFVALPRHIDKSPEIIESVLKYVEESLNITSPEHWYRVSHTSRRKLGIEQLIANNGGIFQVLKQYRPNFSWEERMFDIRPKRVGELS